MKIPFVLTSDEKGPKSLSIVVSGQPFNIDRSGDGFQSVLKELKKENHDKAAIVRLMSRKEAVLHFSGKTVEIRNGKVYFKQKEVGGAVVRKILQFHRDG